LALANRAAAAHDLTGEYPVPIPDLIGKGSDERGISCPGD
jgi:hypothetical protein